MTEYWVSKKSYICKYCDIFIRDDAPSRQQHESGLKHQGNKERFLRNIYKNGEKAKWAAVAEKRQMAKIDKAAGIANNEPLPHIPANSSKTAERPKNVWANYSSAASLGFEVDERPISLTELGHGRGEAGEWEEVAIEPEPVEASIPEGDNALKRRRMMAVGDAEREAEAEARDFDYSVKRRIIYDEEDDYDPVALAKLALRVKEKKVMEEVEEEVKDEVKEEGVKKEGFAKVEGGQEADSSAGGAAFADGLKREGWDGKIAIKGTQSDPTSALTPDSTIKTDSALDSKPEVKPTPGPSMFKKRKGGPARARARDDE